MPLVLALRCLRGSGNHGGRSECDGFSCEALPECSSGTAHKSMMRRYLARNNGFMSLRPLWTLLVCVGPPYCYSLLIRIEVLVMSIFDIARLFILRHIVFPALALLLSALQQAHGNFDSALEMLLSGSVEEGPPQPAPKAAPPVTRVEAVAVVAPTPAPPPPASGGGDADIPEHFLCAITCVRYTPLSTMWPNYRMLHDTCTFYLSFKCFSSSQPLHRCVSFSRSLGHFPSVMIV